MLSKLIRWALIKKSGSDTDQFAVQQLSYLGKTADGLIVFPYGHHANVPPDALALMFAIEGDATNRAAIAWTPKLRPVLKSGEVAFYHPLLPNLIIKLQENGEMLVKSGVKVLVDAPEAEFSGNVTIAGDLDVVGSTTIAGTVENNGVNIGETHIHSQGADSNGDSEADTGVPHS